METLTMGESIMMLNFQKVMSLIFSGIIRPLNILFAFKVQEELLESLFSDTNHGGRILNNIINISK